MKKYIFEASNGTSGTTEFFEKLKDCRKRANYLFSHLTRREIEKLEYFYIGKCENVTYNKCEDYFDNHGTIDREIKNYLKKV